MAKPTNDDKLVAIIAHLSIFLLPISLTLILWILHKDKRGSEWVAKQAKQALILQLSLPLGAIAIAVVGGFITIMTLGLGAIMLIPIIIMYWVVGLALAIHAAWECYNGRGYEYPLLKDFWQ